MATTNVIDINIAAREPNPRDQGFVLLLFLIWPFIAFLMALRDLGSTFYRKIILMFFVLYGFTFYINPVMDGERYANKLQQTFESPTTEVFAIFESLFSEQGALDIVQPIITFLVSRVTGMHHFLFAAFALFFGYFHLKSVSLLNEQYKGSRNINALIILVFMFLVVPIFEINGFRMWSAAWVYFFGVYNYLLEKEKRFIWLAVAASVVHFSFLLPAAVFLLYVLVGNRPVIFMILAVSSFFISELPMPALRSYAAMLGGGLEEKFTSYSNVNHARNVKNASENFAWFMAAPKWLLYSFLIIMVALFRKKSRFKSDNVLNNLLSFSFLFLTFCNIASLIPSGSRFIRVFFLFSCATFIYYYANHYHARRLDKLLLLAVIPMLLVVLINFRIGSETLNTILFLPSPAIMFFYDIDWPVKEWLF